MSDYTYSASPHVPDAGSRVMVATLVRAAGETSGTLKDEGTGRRPRGGFKGVREFDCRRKHRGLVCSFCRAVREPG